MTTGGLSLECEGCDTALHLQDVSDADRKREEVRDFIALHRGCDRGGRLVLPPQQA